MADHDQWFKNLLKEFFAEFLALFYPQWADRLDLRRELQWLEGEVFLDPPQGQRRYIDLVAKVATRETVPAVRRGEEPSWVVLLHVEIEWADAVAALRPRMYDYYRTLRTRHRLPVIPIGLYVRVGLEGIGWDVYEEELWGERLIQFRYPYIGLPVLNAEDFLNGDNWLGVALATLMRIPENERAAVKATALRRLAMNPEAASRRILLCEFVQAYMPLEGPQLEEFERLLQTEPYAEVRAMATTWFEQGEVTGQRKTLLKQLESRFGPLKPETVARLAACSREQLEELTVRVLTAQSLAELGLADDQPA